MIFTEALTKRFGETPALDGLDLAVESGTILGLLGRNGAGKTTAVRILATLLRPDGGRALVGGHDVVREPGAVREQVALAGQQATLDERLTGRENLVLLGRLQRLSAAGAKQRAAELLERFGLTDAATRLVSTYAGGMRRRLDLAACLMVPRPVVFLDEPTTGLDPVSRTEVWNAIRALADDGAAILLTTQYLAEAEHLADRVSVLDAGRVVAEGTPAELKARVGERRVEAVIAPPGTVAAATAALVALGLQAENGRGARVSVPAPAGVDDLTAAIAALTGAGIDVEEASLHRPTLDDAFAALTGR